MLTLVHTTLALALDLATGTSAITTTKFATATRSADTSTITGPVIYAFLPGPQFPQYGSLQAVGSSDPFNVVVYCPPKSTTRCGFPFGNGGTYTAAPSSFYARGVSDQYLYTIDCSLPNVALAVCASTTYGPFTTGTDGLLNVTTTSFSGTITTRTFSGSQITTFPVTITAGATQFLPGYTSSTSNDPTIGATVTVANTTRNSGGRVVPGALAALIISALAFALQ